jgi:hypothetical protein
MKIRSECPIMETLIFPMGALDMHSHSTSNRPNNSVSSMNKGTDAQYKFEDMAAGYTGKISRQEEKEWFQKSGLASLWGLSS